MTAAAKQGAGTFAPLRQKVFAVLWVATIIGNTGSFIRDVASSWLVTDLSATPAAVSMVQAAATLPIFLLAIPAGVLSDILDRRKFLIVVQFLLASASLCLLFLSATGLQSVSSLIALTFVGGIGAAAGRAREASASFRSIMMCSGRIRCVGGEAPGRVARAVRMTQRFQGALANPPAGAAGRAGCAAGVPAVGAAARRWAATPRSSGR